ncbi:hypothetical protein HGRIS_006298 [Hohenbuehelia grisea]|uniref:Protein-S-isoprenylcysteine O-methyltransferase n=1 Tax=Hohenbuehelia grisea TaxID=104357 RepID=A0ABR3K0C4_9AGAR
MSWLRLPFIAAEALGMHVATTPPNPAAASTELIHGSKGEILLKRGRQFPNPFLKALFCFTSIAEATTIIAHHYRFSPIASDILSVLGPSHNTGSPENISLNLWFLLGSLMVSFGGIIRFWCYRELGRFFTFELSLKKDHSLVTTGPYAIVRHPSYTAVVLTVFGALLRHVAPGSWVRESGVLGTRTGAALAAMWTCLSCAIVFGLISRVPYEDEMLEKEFGPRWTAWAHKVRYKMFPGIY